MTNTNDPRPTTASTTTVPYQTHCPSCGQHHLAVGAVITNPDRSWKCERCTRRDAVVSSGERMVPIACPECRGAGGDCVACSGMGKVQMPLSKLNVYDPSAPRVLTEDRAPTH